MTVGSSSPALRKEEDTSSVRAWVDGHYPMALFAVVAVVLYLVAELSFAFLQSTVIPANAVSGFNAWVRWDSAWYLRIVQDGYFYDGPGKQAAVAYFPGYPAMVRAATQVVRNDLVAGVMVSYAAGAAAVALFHQWCRAAFGLHAARMCVLVLVLYPFAYYLFGAVYSDALFLASALGAFVLLESGHPSLAGIVGAVAVGTRPVGMAVVVGLAFRALEIRGVLEGGPKRFFVESAEGPRPAVGHRTPLLPRAIRLRRLNWRDTGVLISVLGLAGFCLLLWRDFGDPFVFRKVYSADGWNRTWEAATLLKTEFFERMRSPGIEYLRIYLGAQGLITVTGVLLVPLILRRLGWGYAAYTVIVLALPGATAAQFLGMGRYALAAFPCFAVVGAALSSSGSPATAGLPLRAWGAAAWLVLSGAGLVLMMSLYARWYLIS